jgi:hypothetical protein
MTFKEFFDRHKKNMDDRGRIVIFRFGDKDIIAWHDPKEEEDGNLPYGLGDANFFYHPTDSIEKALSWHLREIDGTTSADFWCHPAFRLHSITKCEEHFFCTMGPDQPKISFVWDFQE